jgi:hypothetical protein
MVNWICRRGRERVGVALIDSDKVEERNEVRQWAVTPGTPKVEAAAHTLRVMGVRKTTPIPLRFEDLSYAVGTGQSVCLVIAMPDNHLTRVQVHDHCKRLASAKAVQQVWEITAGNDEEHGYAYGCIHKGKRCRGDWTKRHKDVLEEAEREAARLAQRVRCEDIAVEQTVGGNTMTAHCIWAMAETMATDNVVGEYHWAEQEDGGCRIWFRERR